MTIFQKILKEDKYQILWEGDDFFSFLDSFPISPGHCLVIPKRNIEVLEELTKEEWLALKPAIETTIIKLKEANLYEKYSIMYENAPNEKSKEYIKDVLNFLKEKKDFEPDAYNHGINNGKAAGRTVDHLHWHIVPRFEGDVEDPTGEVRYIFPEKGNYRK
jgi:histidine triad (HIT) family protein